MLSHTHTEHTDAMHCVSTDVFFSLILIGTTCYTHQMYMDIPLYVIVC